MTAPKGPAPLCECGCGEPVRSATNGVWSRWRQGHQQGPGTSARTLERRRRAAQVEQLQLFDPDPTERCAACGSPDVYYDTADGWSCHNCHRTDADE